jgi:Ser/Thr protein kinase RdoA (MazF antagonist)
VDFVEYLPTQEDKDVVLHYLRLFETMKPKLDRQRKSVIHGDTNECNVLVEGSKAAGISVNSSLI